MPLTIPDELLNEAGLSEREARLEIACRLYDAGKLTMPQATRWAEVTRVEFYSALLERHLPLVRADRGRAMALSRRPIARGFAPG